MENTGYILSPTEGGILESKDYEQPRSIHLEQ